MGHERGFERARLNTRDGDCHSVRPERRSGLRSGSVFNCHSILTHSTAPPFLAIVLATSLCAHASTSCLFWRLQTVGQRPRLGRNRDWKNFLPETIFGFETAGK